MRILHLTPHYLPTVGGVEVLVSQLIAEHRRAGDESAVLTSSTLEEPEPRVDDVDGVPVCRVPIVAALHAQSPGMVLDAQRRASEFVVTFAPDVMHNHDPGMIGWLFNRIRPSVAGPCAVSLHTTFSLYGARLEAAIRAALAPADVVVAVSAGVADDLRVLLPDYRGPVRIIRNGARAVPPPDAPPPGAHVVSIGRLVTQKAYHRLVDALATARGAGLRVDVAGAGPLGDDLRARAERLGVADRFTLLGGISPTDVPRHLAASSVVAMPSAWEGMPMAAIEAAWAGRAVVGSDVPGLAAVVDHGVTGLLVDAADPDALAEALVSVADDAEYAWTLGRAARTKAEAEFSITRCAADHRQLYLELCGTMA